MGEGTAGQGLWKGLTELRAGSSRSFSAQKWANSGLLCFWTVDNCDAATKKGCGVVGSNEVTKEDELF